jgi:transglutaminase-like putative cysteine protease
MSSAVASTEHRDLRRTTPRANNLELVLQINVGILVVLGTSLLAMGQQNLFYAVAAIVAVATSLIVTDIRGYLRLGPDATTLAALGACVVLVIQVIRNAEQSQLLNVANILIYLEAILLFQQKRDRTYWSLMALSLLQVVVAAALNLGLYFGALLAVYVIIAFSAMTIFFVVRETRPFLVTHHRQLSVTGKGEKENDEDYAQAVSGEQPVRQKYAFVGELPEDSPNAILNQALLRRLLRMVGLTALVTVLLFFAVPRYSNSVWQGARPEQVATVGFTEEVRLDDISRILESDEQVMRVEFTDVGGWPYQVDGEPYFRGTVLSVYKNSVWKPYRAPQATRPLDEVTDFDLANIVLQRITLQPGSHSVLFNVAPCFHVDETPRDLYLNRYTQQLTLSDDNGKPRGAYRYTIGTTTFRNGWQRDLLPAAWGKIAEGTFYDATSGDVRRSHPFLTAKAERELADAGVSESGPFEKAKVLENHFRRSGEYAYSLVINQNRNRNLDPFEDFVRNHRTGHCEYFAGALTLMLRSQGIPARMVVGFKGGEFNTVGNYYIVRELHAHAWVEAFLEAEEIPSDERDGVDFSRYGAWLRLDPTPGSIDIELDDDTFGLVTTMREFVDYVQVLWDDYVLGLNSTRQQQAIYGPIARRLRGLSDLLFSRELWVARWQTFRALATRRILGVPGFMFGVAFLVILAALAHRNRQRLRNLAAWLLMIWRRQRSARKHHGPELAAYRNLEKVLAMVNITRRPGQTPWEFAGEAAHQLASHPAANSFASVPLQIAEAHYRVRYGGQTLESQQEQELTDRVWKLHQALS